MYHNELHLYFEPPQLFDVWLRAIRAYDQAKLVTSSPNYSSTNPPVSPIKMARSALTFITKQNGIVARRRHTSPPVAGSFQYPNALFSKGGLLRFGGRLKVQISTAPDSFTGKI